MSLSDLDVLIIDCQATGATPAHGALLEIGWTRARADAPPEPAEIHRVALPEGATIPRVIRRLTGLDDQDAAEAIAPEEAWRRLRAISPREAAPTLIHFARFELGFLRDLHARFDPETPFPFEVLCAHEIARRLFPDLPRRGLRALAGYLGHGVGLARRSEGHVEATAHVWRHLAIELEARGIHDWTELARWLEAPAPASSGRRAWPMPRATRSALPDRPGVYRFLRSNGDVLYVGKAMSLKKRVASHYGQGARADERALEMLTQARDLDVTETATALEAALLESDEIKRRDPPYNVQLRTQGRAAWFVSRDLAETAPAPDPLHPIGPLPSRLSVSSLGAVRRIAAGEAPDRALRGRAVGVPASFAPEEAVFAAGWSAFTARHVAPVHARSAWGALLRASKGLVEVVAAQALEAEEAEAPPEGWDEDRVRRHLERSVAGGAQLLRRSRWLCLLGDSSVAWCEPGAERRRLLVLKGSEIATTRDLEDDESIPAPPRASPPWRERQAAFDAPRYDRMRVLATELKRVLASGGDVAVRLGARHILDGERLLRLIRWM